jgi:single-stranded-DNA-specific exonuclease
MIAHSIRPDFQSRQWIEPSTIILPKTFHEAIGGHLLIAQTLYRRGFTDVPYAQAFLNPSDYQPASPFDLPDMDKAIWLLEQMIAQKKFIAVWGDFDVDGQTATTLLVSALRNLGAQVTHHIPVRAVESHGISRSNLEQLLDQGIDLLLTCDTGVSAFEEIAYAQTRGVPVIVTDHHDLPPCLPEAYAVINPKRVIEKSPLSTLPGVGVAYKLVEALYQRSGNSEACESFLDLVALGIEADLALQTGDTRYLLQRGLSTLRNTQRLGLKVLMELAEINPQNVTEEHLGFILAPRLNALGRLADANWIVEFLTTENMSRARILATALEGLNAQRKLLTDQVFQAALGQIEADPSLVETEAIILSHPSWPAGIIGVVANRLVERYDKPVLLISTPPGQTARGSARSVEGINISVAIASNQHLLTSFGGHPMAAGFGIEADQIPEFRQELCRTIQQMGGETAPESTLQIDGYLPLSDLSLELVSDLERLAPFGPGNPPLILATRGLIINGYTAVGRNDEHLILNVEDDTGFTRRIIWWQGAGWPLPEGHFDLAYTVRASTYRGQKDVQVEWVSHRPVEETAAVHLPPQPAVIVVDYRHEEFPLLLLEQLVTSDEIQVWREAVSDSQLPGRDRLELTQSKELVIWTIPPGPAELNASLERTSPEKIYLFGIDPGMDQPEAFLKRLTGLVKFTLKSSQGKVRFSALAAATSQHIRTVRAGIDWLEAHGHIRVIDQDGDLIHIEKGDGVRSTNSKDTAIQLKSLLKETSAYRAFFLRTDKESLISR